MQCNYVQRLLAITFGTAKIEELISTQFTDNCIAGMAAESNKGKHSPDTLIQLYAQQRSDVLAAQQNLLRALHFERVNVVGS